MYQKNTPVATLTPTPFLTIDLNALDNVYVYPSLYTGKDGQTGIYFYNVPKYVKLQIFNISGELIYQTEKDDSNKTLFWKVDGRRSSEKLSVGIYIYVLWDGKNKKTGKIAIVR